MQHKIDFIVISMTDQNLITIITSSKHAELNHSVTSTSTKHYNTLHVTNNYKSTLIYNIVQ